MRMAPSVRPKTLTAWCAGSGPTSASSLVPYGSFAYRKVS